MKEASNLKEAAVRLNRHISADHAVLHAALGHAFLAHRFLVHRMLFKRVLWLQLFPYHLADYACRVLRVTPFRYYIDLLFLVMREEKSYDQIPNFTVGRSLLALI